MAQEFWGDALDLSVVRWVDSPFARMTGRAFVTRNMIHWPGPAPTRPDDAALRVLIHELAHCWQHQTGRLQLSRGVIEQSLYTLFGWWMVKLGLKPFYDPYDFGGPAGAATTSTLTALRLEAQAAIVEQHWVMSRSHPADPEFARDVARLCREAGVGAVARLTGRGEDTSLDRDAAVQHPTRHP